MKITQIRTVLCSAPQCDAHMPSRRMRSAAFILVETDTEHVGIGETYAGYFVPEMVPGVVEFYAPILIGADPMEIDVLYQRMFIAGKFWARVGLGSIVMSGIEMALLDLKGKALGVPVYELLGGRCHETLPCYATGGPSVWPREKLEAKVEQYLSLGFHAVKLGGGLYEPGQPIFRHSSPAAAAAVEVEKVEFLQQRFGNSFRLMLDGHMDNMSDQDCLWNEAIAAAVLGALSAYPVEFFEEPLPYTDKRAYRSLRRRSSIPVAGGECLTSLEEWRDWMADEPFDLAQLDASFMGGLTNFMKIAHLCELQGIPIATHAWSATVGVAGNLHAAFACRNTRVVEMAAYNPLRPELNTHLVAPLLTDLWITPPELKDGRLRLPETPGLGIRLTDEFIRQHPYQPGTGEFNSVKGKVLTT
jgi:L-alanine-DL-glutamate epimerase-like enolase superfamily enzyme